MFMHTLRRLNVRVGAQIAKQQASKPFVGNVARRTFSSGTQGGLTGGQMFGAGLGMAAITGLTYLSYMGHKARMHATPEQQLTMFHPVVKSRVQSTMTYFTGSIMATGGLMSVLRNNAAVMRWQFPITIASFVFLLGTVFTDYHTNRAMKDLMFGGFVATSAAGLVPLFHIYGSAVLFDAALLTGATMGSLGAVAYNAPSEQFLKMGGVLAIGLGGLLGASLLQIFFPASRALYSISVYGGIGLFSLFVLYDTQMMLHRAKTKKMYDPVRDALEIYLDALNLFIRFAMARGNSKK